MNPFNKMNDAERLEMLKKANELGLTPEQFMSKSSESDQTSMPFDLNALTNPVAQNNSWSMLDEVPAAPIKPTRSPSQATSRPNVAVPQNEMVQNYLMNKYVKPSEEPDEIEQAQKRYQDRASGLGWAQFLAGMGEAIAGRGPQGSIQAFENIRNNIYQDEVGAIEKKQKLESQKLQLQKEKSLIDPSSPQSQSFRKIIEANFPNIAQAYGDAWSQVTAADQDAIFKPLQLKEQIEGRKQTAAILSQDRQLARHEKSLEKQDKKQQALNEVNDRYINIKDSIGSLKKMVDKYGTQEMFGPENKNMDQYVTAIATDMAKLVDPQSVARDSEVNTFKKMLFEPGFWQRESTVQGVLSNFEKMVDKRLDTAYKVRGLEKPQVVDNSSSQYPMQVRKGNQVATVSNEQELKEARSEGWK